MMKIAYRERGQTGPLVILLHGYAGSVLHWDSIADDLAKKYRVVIPNLAHLYSGRQQFSFAEQVDHLVHFLETHFANEPEIHLCGTSYGGALSWGVMLDYPRKVKSVMLINPMPPNPSSEFALAGFRLFFRAPLFFTPLYLSLKTPIGKKFLWKVAQVFRSDREVTADRVEDLKGRKLQFVAHLIYNFAWILKNENWDRWLDRFKNNNVPCLLIYDKSDPLFRKDTYLRFAKHFSTSHLHEIEGAGHIAIKELPHVLSAKMDTFLSLQYNLEKAI